MPEAIPGQMVLFHPSEALFRQPEDLLRSPPRKFIELAGVSVSEVETEETATGSEPEPGSEIDSDNTGSSAPEVI